MVAVAASSLADGERLTLSDLADLGPGSFALLAIASVALVRRRDSPTPVAVATMAVTMLWAIVGYGDGHDAATVVASYSVGRYVEDSRQSVSVVAGITVVSLLATLIDATQRVDIAPAILLAWVPWYVGQRLRNRGDYLALLQDRAERLETDRHEQAQRAVADERARIARELHDVVAHQVSMMTVQAGAAKTIARDDLDAAVEAMGDVERAGRNTLDELRHLLSVLRPGGETGEEMGPQPGLADVPAIVDELALTGARVASQQFDRPGHLSAAVELAAYRIVQESLTNVIKHAGPEPTVEISVAAGDRELVIEVANSTSSLPPVLPPSGYGIVGMRERATLLGGDLTAGPEPPGRFRVRARIPIGIAP